MPGWRRRCPGVVAQATPGTSQFNGINKMKRFQPHFSPEQLEHIVSTATAIGEGFARHSDREIWIWSANSRNEMCDECCSPVTDLKNLRTELDCIDAILSIVENRRAEVRAAMIPADQRYLR
jgi:hypothetical protein